MQGTNRKLSTHEIQNSHPNQYQQIHIGQQQQSTHPQPIQMIPHQQLQQQLSSLSPQRNIRIDSQNSPCRIVNIQPMQQVQQIHKVPQQQYYLASSVTPIRQRITSQSIPSSSLNSLQNISGININPHNQMQNQQKIPSQQQQQQFIAPLQNQSQNQQNTSQNIQASSKPISQMPEKHRLLQQSSKINTANNQNNNNNSNNGITSTGQLQSYQYNQPSQPQQQQGYPPNTLVRSSVQRIKHRSEINLPSEITKTPLQHIQTPSQMINLSNPYPQSGIISPPANITISQNLYSHINDETMGTPMNRTNNFLTDNNAPTNNGQAQQNMQISSSNNISQPQTAVKYVNQIGQIAQDRDSSPYYRYQNQMSTNQKSPNMQSTNLGYSTQNSSQHPYIFSEEAAIGSIHAAGSTSANRYLTKSGQSPERIHQFLIKQNGQQPNNVFSQNVNNPLANKQSIGVPQQTKVNTEIGRSSSCSDIRKSSQYNNRNILQWDNSTPNSNQNYRGINFPNTNNDNRNLDRSVERTSGYGNDGMTSKPYTQINQSGSFTQQPRTPTKINTSQSTQNLNLHMLNSNSKKLKELEEQIRDLVFENTKLSQLLEEKGSLLQQLQDEKVIQKLLGENNDLKEKLRKAQIDNDLNIQNRVLHTENANLNKILSEKVREIRELKEKLQQSLQNQESQKKVVELERNIKLLISENEHLSEILKQRQNEIQKVREDNSESQNKIINMQSHISDLQEKLMNHDSLIMQIRSLEQQNRSLEKNSVSTDQYFALKNDYDQLQMVIDEKHQEETEKDFKLTKAEEQVTKLVEENEKLNEIISQYINTSHAELLNSYGLSKNTLKLPLGIDEEEKLMIFDSLQNCNKDYEEKINNLVSQNKNLEEVILELEKDKIDLAENLQFMEDRQKLIEKQNEDFQTELEQLRTQEVKQNQNSESEARVQLLENENLEVKQLLDQANQQLHFKSEEYDTLFVQQEDNKNLFEQIMQEKLEQINRLNEQISEQQNYIEALQQQGVVQSVEIIDDEEEDMEEEEKKKKASRPQKESPKSSEELQSNKSSQRNSNRSIRSNQESQKLSKQQNEEENSENVLEISKFKEELKEKNDIIKNLCENLDFQKEQVNELNDKVQEQSIFILQQQEQIDNSHNEINQQSEKILELLTQIGQNNQTDHNSGEVKEEIDLSSSQCKDLIDLKQQVENKDGQLQENILTIKGLESKVIDLQNQLKEFKPDLQIDTSSCMNIERLESQYLLSPDVGQNLREKKTVQFDDKLTYHEQQQDQDQENGSQESDQQKQHNPAIPQEIQNIIDREISQFDQKYRQKMEDLEKEMHISLSEREGKINELVNENQKLLQLNEQRLIELQILNQQIEMRKEQGIRDTKTNEELQKKIQMMLSKNISFNKGISKSASIFQSERSLIDSIREEESEESQEIDGQKSQHSSGSSNHEIRRLQRKLEEKRRQLSDAKQEIENLKEKILDFEESEFRITSENRQLQEEVRRLNLQSGDYNKLNEMLKTRKNEYSELKKRYEGLKQEKDELGQRLSDLRSNEGSPTNQQSKSYNVNSFELYKEIESIKRENSELKKVQDSFVTQLKKQEKDIAEKQEELEQVKHKFNEINERKTMSSSAPQSFYQNQSFQGSENQIQKPKSASNL